MQDENTSFARLLAPRYWGIWLLLGALRGIALLPYPLLLGLGRLLGRLGFAVGGRRRQIAERNIATCFPALDPDAQTALVRAHFEALGIGMFETALCWWGSDTRLQRLAQLEGIEHLEQALARGKGVLLLSAHFTCLEIGARLLCFATPLHVMYRRHENALWEWVLRRRRDAHAEKVIGRHDVRGLLRSLRQGKAVWFAPDQASRGKDAALAPFFSVPAMTNAATSRIARISGAAVLPFFPRRLEKGGYRLVIEAPLADFPSDDPVSDATRFNALVTAQAREAPEQYLWIHRRFKNRPPPLPDIYAGLE